jgi:hypothetical protein
MFGLGDILGSSFIGKFLDSLGLDWLNNFISLAANVASGNWIAAAKDVFDLVAEFSDSSWMQRVSSLAPLGEFDLNSTFDLSSLTSSRIAEIRDFARSLGVELPKGIEQAIDVIRYTSENSSRVNEQVQNAQRYAHV